VVKIVISLPGSDKREQEICAGCILICVRLQAIPMGERINKECAMPDENSGDETRIDVACYCIAIGRTQQGRENYAECNSDWNKVSMLPAYDWVFIKIVALNQVQFRIRGLEEDPPDVAEQ